VWGKIPALIDTFRRYPEAEWVWFLDLDAIIMSPEYDLVKNILSKKGLESKILRSTKFNTLELYTPPEQDWKDIDFIIAQDHNGLNAGSFLVRRSRYTEVLLDFWADPLLMIQKWPGREQEALVHFLKYHPTFRTHLGLVPQRSINSYAEGGSNMKWQKGDVAVHFAGCWVGGKCQKWWTEYWGKRTIL
jgi:hypothetical protein